MLGDDGERIFTRCHAVDSRLLVPALHGADVVHVIVDEARNDGAALKIHDQRIRTRERGHFVVGACCKNPVAIECNGFDDVKVFVDGKNPAVAQDPIRSLCGGGAGRAVID